MSNEGVNSPIKLKNKTKRLFSDYDILIILKLNTDFPNCPNTIMAEVTGVTRSNIAKIISGNIKKLDNNVIELDLIKYQEIKTNVEKIIKNRKENVTRDYEAIGKKQALSKRVFSVETMKEILKDKHTTKSYTEMVNEQKYKQKNGTTGTVDMISNVCNGKYQLFEEDFANKEEYDEYLKIIKQHRPVNTGMRNPAIKLLESAKSAKYAKNHRILPLFEMIKILRLKKVKTSADVLAMEFTNLEGKLIKLNNMEQVNRIWRGNVKIYDTEFSDDFTAEEYQTILNLKPLHYTHNTLM